MTKKREREQSDVDLAAERWVDADEAMDHALDCKTAALCFAALKRAEASLRAAVLAARKARAKKGGAK